MSSRDDRASIGPEGQRAQPQEYPAGRHHDRRRVRACGARQRRRAGAGAGAGDRGGPTAEHPRHLRRRCRPDQRQRLLARPHGLPDAEHRPHRQGRHDVHRLLCRAELHGGAVIFITGQATLRTGLSKVGLPGANLGLRSRTSRSRRRSSRWAMPPASSARTISATATSSCRRSTASTSSSATSTTSMPRRSPSIPTIPKDPRFRAKFGPRGVLKSAATDHRRCDRRPALRQGRPAEDRGHRPADQEAHGDHRRRDLQRAPSTSSSARPAPTSRSSCWLNGTRMHLYTHVRPEYRGQERRQRVSSTAWWSTTAMSASC